MTYKNKKISIIIFLCICFLILIAHGLFKSGDLHYIYIGTYNDDFEDNDKASASGEAIEGEVFVYINNNCIKRYSGFGTVMQVNQWLKKGENEYSFKGTSSKSIYVKIIKCDFSGKRFKILAKNSFGPGKIEVSGKFDVDINYSLSLFQSEIPNRTTVEKEIEAKVGQLKSMFDERNRPELCETFLAGPALWQPVAYGIKWSDLEPVLRKKLFNQYLRGKQKIISFKPDELKFIIGSNSVYVYSDINQSDFFKKDFLFKMKKKNGSLLTLPALKFIKLKNRWIVWE